MLKIAFAGFNLDSFLGAKAKCLFLLTPVTLINYNQFVLMILYTEDKTQIEFHKEIGLLEVRWFGKIEKQEFALIWEKVLEYVKKYNVKNLLLDASLLQSSPFIHDDRAINFFQTELSNTSLEKLARVGSEVIQDNLEVEEAFHYLEDKNLIKFIFKHFKHHYEAVDWLLEKPLNIN